MFAKDWSNLRRGETLGQPLPMNNLGQREYRRLKKVEITLNIYAHVLPDMQRQAAATLGGLLHR